MRDETRKHGDALQAAGKNKASPEQVRKLFKLFIAAESEMLKGIEDRSALCRIPADAITQMRATHVTYSRIANRVCEMAMPGPTNLRYDLPGSSGDFWRQDELQRLFGEPPFGQ